ncbi:DNA polymerase Y family protein [Reyranella sp.]|uniref:Y-family DNA polymerase n=1 Tax=Reyranella sp. TaxID=1929291 RepID=UPI003BAB4E93
MKRMVSLWFPKLSTDRLARMPSTPAERAWSDRSAATVAWLDGCPRLLAVNPHARSAGLRPHLRLADARALVPDLVTQPGEPQADRRLLEAIASWCDRYTPWVAIDPLGGALAEEGTEACSAGGFGGDAGLLLDVTGCSHLFGAGEAGERALLADLVQRLARRDLTCRAAMADTAGAAWALARHAERQADLFCPARGQREALAALPVEGLRLDAPILETFLKLGLRRIGDLYPLPRAPLARRFGDQPLRRLDQALGTIAELVEPRRPPPAFRTRLAFVEPIGRPEDIAAATSRLLAALCRQFEQAGVGARRLEIALYRVDGSVDRTAIGTSRPNRDNPRLMKLFEEKLGELDPGFGVELMILAAPEVEAFDGTQEALPDGEVLAAAAGTAGPDGAIDLADRLALRLGAGNVVRLLPRDSHLPERVQVAGPIGSSIGTPARAGAWRRVAELKGARPTRLLQRPEPVDVTAFVPDDPPSVFRWRQHAHRIVRAEGPERVADEWWRPRPDGSRPPANIVPPFRDYYRVEDDDGGRFWLFRDGPYAVAGNGRPTARWFLHGFCA